jgi:cephalosporin-C deacetylase-like acetyl esterase
MANQPAFGMQIQDVICALSYLENRNEIDKEKIGIIGKGLGGLLALYASAFNSKFKITAIIENLYTYKSLVENDIYNYGLEVVIPGVLKYYDIPNLAGTIAPRPLSILNPTDHNKKVVDKEILYSNYKWTNNVYSKMNSGKNLQILTSFKDEEINQKLIEWINLFRN